jgi:nucleotide-binding universal stress UspA family protein
MGKYNRLVVAMDGSLASQNALKQAFKLAQDEKRWITVIAINPPYQGDLDLVGVSNIAEILKGPGEKILAEAKEIAEKEGVTIRTRLEEGEPFEKIIDVAEDEGSDLIVMGRRGITRLEKALMGSVTAKVIGHFSGRVLIVPRDTTLGWEHILVASDGSKYGDAAVSEAINYAKSYGGSLTIVSAIDVTEEFQALAPDTVDKMIEKAKKNLHNDKKKAEREGVSAETYVREGESYKVIVDFAAETKANTIVLGSHGRTGLKRIFMGSVTSRVIGHTPCPVMVIHK